MAFRSTWSPGFDCLVRAGNQGIAYGSSTLAVWARLDDTALAYEAIEINNSNGTAFFTSAISVFANNWAFHSTNSAGTRVSYNGTAVATNTWVHLVLTFNGTTMVSYVNGAQVDSRAGPAGPFGNWADIQVGPALGYLQDAFFYTRALTALEVQQLYARRLPPSLDQCRHWLPIFPGSIRTKDLSGNGLDFSASGTPTDPGSTIPLPPVGWGGTRPRIILPSSSAISIAADGSTQVTGASTLVAGKAVVPGGLTQVTGAANMLRGMNVAGSTQVTGAAALTKSAPLVPSGLTQTTGAAAVSASGSFSLTAAGSTQVSGAATSAISAPLAAAGLTRVSGAAIEGGASPIAGGGMTQCTGSAVVSSSAPAAPAYAVHLWRRSRRGR